MKKILTLVMTTLIFSACVAQESEETIYEGVEFEMPKVVIPTFPDYRVSIVDFGAIADGTTKNTQAIAEAISDVVKNGGGTVVIPRGIWVTGPVTLKSNLKSLLSLSVEECLTDKYRVFCHCDAILIIHN